MWNIVVGIIFIIGGLSGQLVLRGTESSGALVVVGILLFLWGVYQVTKKSSNKKKALNNPVLENPNVVGFYTNTLNAWASGKLDYLAKTFQQGAAKLDCNGLIGALPPTPGSALGVFFERYQPIPGEYLIGIGNESSGKAWFVLTNFRLVQKDGKSSGFYEIYLEQIQEYITKGTMTKELTFVLKNGENVLIEKVAVYPSEDHIRKLLAQIGQNQQGQIPG